MTKLLEKFGTRFLPAFPPKDFYERTTPEDFTILGIEAELQELARIREVLKPHLEKFPREARIPFERVQYLVDKVFNDK